METMTMIGWALYLTFAVTSSVAVVLYLIALVLRLMLDRKRVLLEEQQVADGKRSQDRLSEMLGEVVPAALQAMSPSLPPLPSSPCVGCPPKSALRVDERMDIEQRRLDVEIERLDLEKLRTTYLTEEIDVRIDTMRKLAEALIEGIGGNLGKNPEPTTDHGSPTPAEA